MRKKIIISLILFIVLLVAIFIHEYEKKSKFYLDDKYYSSNEFISVEDLNEIEHDSYIMYTYGDFCAFSTPCEDIFKSFMDQYNISFIKMHYDNFKNTKYYKSVLYPPSVLIIKKGKLIAFLNAEDDNDINKYQDPLEFKNWVDKYVYLDKNS